jgi:hypothetical protein
VEASEGVRQVSRLVRIETALPVGRREVTLEQGDEARRDVVGVGHERLPLVEDHVDRYAEVGESRASLEKPPIGHSNPAVPGGLDESERHRAVHDLCRHGSFREAGEQLGRIEDHRVDLAEKAVELCLDTDDGIEAAALLPLLEQVGDASQRVALSLQAGDQPKATEVGVVIPAGAAFEPWRGQQERCEGRSEAGCW